jgi:hypothetical protein
MDSNPVIRPAHPVSERERASVAQLTQDVGRFYYWRMKLLRPAALAVVVLAVSCGSGADSSPAATPPADTNLLENPGLELGGEPWYSLEEPSFVVTRDEAHSGSSSALLRLRADPDHEGTRVHHLVQDVQVEEGQPFPEVLSGFYRIGHWARDTDLQYVQAVVAVFESDNLPAFLNHQVRYVLAGLDEEPFSVGNARFVLLGEEEPEEGRWISFHADVRDDFERLWGAVPEGYNLIRVLFELRYDNKASGETPEADVYFDDLYLGPAY